MCVWDDTGGVDTTNTQRQRTRREKARERGLCITCCRRRPRLNARTRKRGLTCRTCNEQRVDRARRAVALKAKQEKRRKRKRSGR